MININIIGLSKKEKYEKLLEEYEKEVKDILEDEVVFKMNQFNHHYNTTCYQHSLNVSFYCYLICKKFNWDYKSAARAGMLHDLFLYDWTCHKKQTGERFHAMTHPKVAYNNAAKRFKLNPIESDIILKHMWPLTVRLPHYRETYIIVLIDKYCGTLEIIQHFIPRAFA